MKKKDTSSLIRYVVQAGFFAFIAFVAIRHQIVRGGPGRSATVHAYCPFGAIESLYTRIVHGEFLWKIQYSSFVLLAAVIVISLIMGKGFCGWICPFGSLMEWLRLLGKKTLGIKKSFIPDSVEKKMRYLKYGVIFLILVPTYYTGRMVFEDYDPFVAFFHFGRNMSGDLMPAYIILAVVLVASLFSSRFWCRYFCPLGALLGLLNKISLFSIRRDSKTCKECWTCSKKCPVGVMLDEDNVIKSVECTACLECVNACTHVGTLKAKSWKFTHSSLRYAICLIATLFIIIGVTKAIGIWQSTGSSGEREYRGYGRGAYHIEEKESN